MLLLGLARDPLFLRVQLVFGERERAGDVREAAAELGRDDGRVGGAVPGQDGMDFVVGVVGVVGVSADDVDVVAHEWGGDVLSGHRFADNVVLAGVGERGVGWIWVDLDVGVAVGLAAHGGDGAGELLVCVQDLEPVVVVHAVQVGVGGC